MKKVTIRLNEQAAGKLAVTYGKLYPGASWAANSFPYIRERTIAEIKNVFTRQELSAIVDNYNGTLIQEECMFKDFLIAHLEDGEKYENLSQKWGFDMQHLILKLQGMLTEAQVFFLLDEVNRFWNDPAAYGAPSPDLDKFLDFLTLKKPKR